MISYIDSSVLLRVVLGEPKRLKEWENIKHGVSSALIEVECLRTLDRLRVSGKLTSKQLVSYRETMFEMFDALEIVEISRPVLSRASSPFPTALGTLDAIHLSTALAYSDIRGQKLVFATHDMELASGAKSVGMEVLGC